MRMLIKKQVMRRLLKDESAVTVIEFAFLAPVFFMLLFMVLETGFMLFTEYRIQSSLQQAARLVRTGQAQTQRIDANTFKDRICSGNSAIPDCRSKVVVYMKPGNSFTELATNTPSYVNIGPTYDSSGVPTMPGSEQYDCGRSSEPVVLIATYDWQFKITPLGNFLANTGQHKGVRRLVGFAIFRNEPYPSLSGNSC
jgi:hypothetical protein